MMTPCQLLTTDVERIARQRLKVFPSIRLVQTVVPGSRRCLPGIFITIIAIFSFCSATNAAEIASFRTTDIESKVELHYLFDERINSNAGIETSMTQQITYEEEFSVLTQNYVYHPNFLKLDLGAGITFVQDSFKSSAGSNENNDDLYSLNVRASLLEKKPYPMSVYYARDNPKYYIGLADPVRLTNTRYGFDFALLDPLIPLKITLFASSDDSNGNSPTETVDESNNRFGIRASKVYSDNYSHEFSFEHTEEDSASGSLALPINPNTLITDQLTYSSDWRFGAQHQYKYSDRVIVYTQDRTIIRDEVRFDPRLLWTHSEKAQSTYSYKYLDTSEDSIDTNNQSATGRLNYQYSNQIVLDAGARIEDNATTGVDNRSIGTDGGISYHRPLRNGSLTLNAALDYSQNDRDATAISANIIDERVTLVGLTPVALSNGFIVSVSIVVQNLARTQTYIEGVDYRLIVVGSRTEIQRLSGSNIGDPEQVSVDYAYQTGGSAAFTDLSQNYSAFLSIGRYNLYLRYLITDQDLTSGSPTLPLNSTNRLSFGGAADYRLNKWIEVGANIDLVRQEEDISPYDSQRYTAFSRFNLPGPSNLTLGASQLIIDNINSVEDTDQTSFSMMLSSRPRNRMMLSAEINTEEDTGGTIINKRDYFRLTAQWRIYRLLLNAQALYSNDQTGKTETERTRFMVTIRRDI